MKKGKRSGAYKIYLGAVFILPAAFVLAGCASGPEGEENASGGTAEGLQPIHSENWGDGADENEVPAEEGDIYNNVLEQYRDMVRNDFYEELRDTDAYEGSFGEDIGFEIRAHRQGIYYALYDIDGNGTEELIIAGGENAVSNPEFAPWNYDLYGYDGTRAVHIFPEMDFGYRTNFSLYENGIIEVFYSGSAAESGVDFYKISADGAGAELVDSFASVGRLEGDEPVFSYYQNGEEITEDDYSAKIQSYEIALTTALEWTQIQ